MRDTRPRITRASKLADTGAAASSANQKRHLAWRDQLRRLGVENVVLVPRQSLGTMGPYLVNAQKFAHKISSLIKEVI